MTAIHTGDQLDHYRIEGVVARSGMASIFRGTDLRTGRTVAIKVPHPEMEGDPVFFDRFQREEEIGQKLDHPGVMKVFADDDRSKVYMVMEWVDGRLLRQILNESGKLPPERAARITARILQCTRLHSQERRRPPRPEAREHHGRRGGQHQAHRLRNCSECGVAAADVREALADNGHPGLHFTRAGERVSAVTRAAIFTRWA